MFSNFAIFLFMLGISLGAGLCIVGIASPEWFGLYDDRTKEMKWGSLWDCVKEMTDDNPCTVIFKNSGPYVQAVIALTIIGILAAIAALVWSILLCFACCCKSCLGPALPLFATIAFCCQLSAVVIHGVKNLDPATWKDAGKDPINALGYSYCLVIAGTVVYFIDIFLGVLAVVFSPL